MHLLARLKFLKSYTSAGKVNPVTEKVISVSMENVHLRLVISLEDRKAPVASTTIPK
jgi:hypothetical protein